MGGGKKPVAKQPTKALGIDFQGAQYGPPVPVVYGKNKVAGNCIWYGDFQAIAQQQKQSGGKGGGGSSTTTSYTYKASYQLALCEGPIVAVSTVYNGTSTTTVSALGGVVALGTKGQAPWAHLSGSAALGYSNTALVSFQSRDLGSQASLPNDNFEVKGLLPFGGSIDDADPSAVFADICNDTTHGLSGVVPLGSLTQWSNYCVAAGLFLSPVYDQQDTAQSALEDLLKYANAAAWFSEGVVKVGCYGDQTITGNGVTYTPELTSVASLGPDDFITNGATAPVTVKRTSPADALNLVRVEFTDRAHTYHTSAVVASFAQDINANGMRSDDSEQVDMATNATVARLISQNLLQRSFYVRNQYEFKLSWRYCYLEPFDIVQLTDANTGLSSAPVRILSIEEDEHGLLDVVAEECPEGIGHSEAYGTQANAGTTVDPNADPGPVAGPYLFRGPGFLVGNNKPEIWCAVTGDGNPLWAGCDVYLSHDGTSYTYLCSYARQSRYGHITNSMGVQSDPDTVSAPNVVLNGYQTQLLGGSQADADQFITLCMIDGEVMAYETATLAAGPSYNLSYLRRGGYGTAIAAHSANAPFVRLDDGILRIPVDPSQIGQTVYLKFLSVNCFGRTPRTLSGETAYQYVIGTSEELPDVPVVPASFTVLGVADGVHITWTNNNPAAVGCTSIEYATNSAGPWTVLAQVGPTTTFYHHGFTNGATYYYRARSRGPVVSSGWSAYTDVFSSAGVDVSKISNTATAAQNSAPIINPNFGTGDLTGWTSDYGTWAFQQGTAGPETSTSTYAIRTGSAGTPTDTLRNIGKIPVYAGAVVKAACSIRANGANGTCACLISWRDAGNAEIHVTQGNTVTGTTLAASFACEAAPAGAIMAHVEAAAISHTTGTYTVDGFIAPILPDTLDQVPDGTSKYGAVYNPGTQTGMYAPGQNIIYNPMFQLGTVGYQSFDSWVTENNSAAGWCADINLAANSGTRIIESALFPCNAGDAFSAALDYWLFNAITAGDLSGDIRWYNSSKVAISGSGRIMMASGSTSGWTHATLQNQIAPTGTAYVSMRVFTEGASGGHVLVRRLKLEKGATCTPFDDGATQYGNNLTVPGSQQQLGDQRNLPSSISRNMGLARSATALTAHAGGSVDINAHDVYIGSAILHYNAHTSAVTGLATGSSYWIYTRDSYAGGSPTFASTTSALTANSFDDAYNAGQVTIPASGTSGGGGAGGTGTCVCAYMYLRDGLTAEGFAMRWRWWKPWTWWVQGHDGWHCTRRRPFLATEPCVRLIAEDGAFVDCSVSTPVTTQTGESIAAPQMYGHAIASEYGWKRVVDVRDRGVQRVVRIDLGGHCLYAGANASRRLSTHNWNK